MDVCSVAADIYRTQQSFQIEMVESSKQLREVFRLRYQVYCVERGFLPGDEGEESDEFDSFSRHILLRETSTGEAVGTARVIGPNIAKLHNSFPIQHVCDPNLIRDVPLRQAGEISRFALSKERRIRTGNMTLLRLSLVRGLVQISAEMGLTHWLAVMERSLIRLNERNAIYFETRGPLVDYHGPRQPMVAELSSMLERVRLEEFPTWDFLTNGGTWYRTRQSSRSRIVKAA